MKQLSEALKPGNAALFLLIKKFSGDKVLKAVKARAEQCSRRCSTTARKRLYEKRSPQLKTFLWTASDVRPAAPFALQPSMAWLSR